MVAWSAVLSAPAAVAAPDTLEVTRERSTSAFSRLKPPTPQPPSASVDARTTAFVQAEAKTDRGRLRKACRTGNNRQLSLASDGINKL
jgi:hypothetical protein